MKDIINKELLGEILELDKNLYIDSIGKDGDIVQILIKPSVSSSWDLKEINKYQLVHTYKEYLLDKGYYIAIHPFKVELFKKDTNEFIKDFHYPTQSGEIPYDVNSEIQACQWILVGKY